MLSGKPGVYVSVHTSNLANSQFMRPGAAVFEIIQRNWAYHGLDKSFQVQNPGPWGIVVRFSGLV